MTDKIKKLLILLMFFFISSCSSSYNLNGTKMPFKSFVFLNNHAIISAKNCNKNECSTEIETFKYSGSGVILAKHPLNKDYKLILTAEHICNPIGNDQKLKIEKLKIKITSDLGFDYPGKVIVTDPQSDLCILQIYDEDNLMHPIKISSKSITKRGTRIFNIGAPGGVWGPGMTPIFMGIYSGKIFIPELKSKADVYTFNAYPGSSGSPIFNINGKLVGLVHRVDKFTNHIVMSSELDKIKLLLDRARLKIINEDL